MYVCTYGFSSVRLYVLISMCVYIFADVCLHIMCAYVRALVRTPVCTNISICMYRGSADRTERPRLRCVHENAQKGKYVYTYHLLILYLFFFTAHF